MKLKYGYHGHNVGSGTITNTIVAHLVGRWTCPHRDSLWDSQALYPHHHENGETATYCEVVEEGGETQQLTELFNRILTNPTQTSGMRFLTMGRMKMMKN